MSCIAQDPWPQAGRRFLKAGLTGHRLKETPRRTLPPDRVTGADTSADIRRGRWRLAGHRNGSSTLRRAHRTGRCGAQSMPNSDRNWAVAAPIPTMRESRCRGFTKHATQELLALARTFYRFQCSKHGIGAFWMKTPSRVQKVSLSPVSATILASRSTNCLRQSKAPQRAVTIESVEQTFNADSMTTNRTANG